jgi:hypothetical protein
LLPFCTTLGKQNGQRSHDLKPGATIKFDIKGEGERGKFMGMKEFR